MLNGINNMISAYRSPFKPVIVISPANLHKVPDGSIAAILLSADTAESFRHAFRQLSQSANQFVVCWQESRYDATLAELVVHAFFSPNYLSIQNRPVLIVRNQNGSASTPEILISLRNFIIAQGFANVETWIDPASMLPGTNGHSAEIILPTSHEGVAEPRFVSPGTNITNEWLNENMFRDLASMTTYVVIDSSDMATALGQKQLLDNALEAFLEQRPGMAGVLNEYLEMRKSFEKINAAHKQVSERLAGAERTIDVVRTKYKEDYENLFKWYHNEYEILPLWYKRFGHILKVIMGKRSFRSLFSDDVKKYKT